MFFIFYTNFGYGPDASFSTEEEAIVFARSKGFEATVRYKDAVVNKPVGCWSPIGGYRSFFVEAY